MLIDRVGLPADELAQLTAIVAGQGMLDQVIRGWAARHPRRLVVDVVTQDEYTHDVILPYRDQLHLVYDTT